MAQWALQFTPLVTLEPTRDVLLLEVRASLRLYGGLQALLSKLQQGWLQLGWQPPDTIRMACAPTAKAAHWQVFAVDTCIDTCIDTSTQIVDNQAPAQFKANDHLSTEHISQLVVQLISSLPVGVIEEAEPHLSTLERMGIRTVGQLSRLPRGGITRRFGKRLLQALDSAHGRHPDLRVWVTAPHEFHQVLELPARADNHGLITLGARRLLQELAAWLRAKQSGVRQLTLTLMHDNPPHTNITLGFAEPTQDPARFERLLSERLARHALARPVYELALHAQNAESLAGTTVDFFAAAPTAVGAATALPELIERLQARLGSEHVQQLSLRDDHRPEIAMVCEPVSDFTHQRSPVRKKEPTDINFLPESDLATTPQSHRPAWLLATPIALKVQAHRPVYHGQLRLLCGPERIEAGWWEDTPQGAAQRDYFIACSSAYELLWVYRTPQHQWYLHGFFS
jgi:protein ImuB